MTATQRSEDIWEHRLWIAAQIGLGIMLLCSVTVLVWLHAKGHP
jgi:hypothetical protein